MYQYYCALYHNLRVLLVIIAFFKPPLPILCKINLISKPVLYLIIHRKIFIRLWLFALTFPIEALNT